jgi:hypothetical protein
MTRSVEEADIRYRRRHPPQGFVATHKIGRRRNPDATGPRTRGLPRNKSFCGPLRLLTNHGGLQWLLKQEKPEI